MNANQNRQWGVLLSYVSMALSFIIGMFYTPYALQCMGQSEYGTYQYISSLVNYLSLLTCGFGSAYLRFSSPYKLKGDKDGVNSINGLFLTLFLVMGSVALVIGGIMIGNSDWILGGKLTSEELETGKALMIVLVINLFLSFPISVFNSYIIAQEKFVFQKALALFSSLLNYGVSILALTMGHKALGVTVSMLLISVLTNTVIVLFCLIKLKMRFRFRFNDAKNVKEVFVFSSFLLLSMIVDQINWSVDKFLLGKLCGTAAVAIYSVGATINTHYKSVGDAISNVYVPKVYSVLSREDGDHQATLLMSKLGRIQTIILALILTGFIAFGMPFIQLWVGNEYYESYYVILLMLIPVTIPEIQKIGLEIQKAKNMHKFRSIIYAIIAAVNLLISIPLCIYAGAIGAAIGTAVTIVLGNGLIMNLYYHKKVHVDMIYFWKQILKLLPAVLMSGVLGAIISWLVSPTSWLALILSVLGYVVVYMCIVIALGMNRDERQFLKKVIMTIFKRKNRGTT